MKMRLPSLAILLLVSMPGISRATDKVVHLAFNNAVVAATQSGKLDGSVKFYLADIKPAGQATVLKTVTVEKKTNAFGKQDQVSCDWALQSALISLQGDAKEVGADAVVDIVSDYDNEYRDNEKYECHVGFLMSGVVLKAKLAKLQP
jgi:uncharacterized protein YbjQ (UPF0145 family)